MSTVSETSDQMLLDLLRRSQGMSISQLIESTGVTATAVRQRLARLTAQGLVTRKIARIGRGRPSHTYQVTEKGQRQAGSNFSDLAFILWRELRSVRDPSVRSGLLQRIARSLADAYRDRIGGEDPAERMESLRTLFAERGIELQVEKPAGQLPVLTVLDCPYPDLAERDRSVCAMEKMLFEELLNSNIRLTTCRLEGHACCQFASN